MIMLVFTAAVVSADVQAWDDAHEMANVGQVAIASSSTLVTLLDDPTPRMINVGYVLRPTPSNLSR